jgi:hypothetical protein
MTSGRCSDEVHPRFVRDKRSAGVRIYSQKRRPDCVTPKSPDRRRELYGPGFDNAGCREWSALSTQRALDATELLTRFVSRRALDRWECRNVFITLCSFGSGGS